MRTEVMKRVEQYGFDALTDTDKVDLALVLIGYNGRRPPFKTLYELFSAQRWELDKYFTPLEQSKLTAINEVSASWIQEKVNQEPLRLSGPSASVEFLKLKMSRLPVERSAVVFLNTRNCFLDYQILSEGTLNRTAVFPREIAKKALEKDAAAVILAHNHPSGIAAPSSQDLSITQIVRKALDTLGITMLDHIIIGKGDTFSFAENKLMEGVDKSQSITL